MNARLRPNLDHNPGDSSARDAIGATYILPDDDSGSSVGSPLGSNKGSLVDIPGSRKLETHRLLSMQCLLKHTARTPSVPKGKIFSYHCFRFRRNGIADHALPRWGSRSYLKRKLRDFTPSIRPISRPDPLNDSDQSS